MDAKNFLNDILELLYLFSRKINLGSIQKDASISESETQLIEQYSKNLNMQDLGLFWQLTIKTIEDLKVVSNENLALEMYVMQLMHLKNIEKSEEVFSNDQRLENNQNFKTLDKTDEENENKKMSSPIKNQLKSTDQVKTNLIKNPDQKIKLENNIQINSLEDLIRVAEKEKEIELKYDLERNVRLVSFKRGKIDIGFNEKLNKKFIKVLTEKLLSWTGERWIISLSKENGSKTVHEKEVEQKSQDLLKEKKGEVAKKMLSAFSDAKLIDVKDK